MVISTPSPWWSRLYTMSPTILNTICYGNMQGFPPISLEKSTSRTVKTPRVSPSSTLKSFPASARPLDLTQSLKSLPRVCLMIMKTDESVPYLPPSPRTNQAPHAFRSNLGPSAHQRVFLVTSQWSRFENLGTLVHIRSNRIVSVYPVETTESPE